MKLKVAHRLPARLALPDSSSFPLHIVLAANWIEGDLVRLEKAHRSSRRYIRHDQSRTSQLGLLDRPQERTAVRLTLTSILGMLSYFDFLNLLPKGGTISNTVFTSNVNLHSPILWETVLTFHRKTTQKVGVNSASILLLLASLLDYSRRNERSETLMPSSWWLRIVHWQRRRFGKEGKRQPITFRVCLPIFWCPRANRLEITKKEVWVRAQPGLKKEVSK